MEEDKAKMAIRVGPLPFYESNFEYLSGTYSPLGGPVRTVAVAVFKA